MPFPKNEAELKAQGYEYENTRRCTGPTCGATVAWYRTPGGKLMPLDQKTFEPHWATCSDANRFRRKK